MNILLCSGAPRSTRVRDFLRTRCDRLLETAGAVDLATLRADKIDWIVSHGYGPIFREPVLPAYAGKIVNIHNTYLPWGRGIMGNVWSYFDDTPKGVSLHFIDAGIDTGEIIARQLLDLPQDATLQSSWDLLMTALEDLFIARWDSIVAAHGSPQVQARLPEIGTYRSRAQSLELLALFPKGWGTPVAEVAALGREYRANPEAFERTHGLIINPKQLKQADGSSQEYTVTLCQARVRTPQRETGPGAPGLEAAEATPDDKLDNWLWVNDPVTRRMFKLNDYIGWGEHCRWYEALLKDPDRLLCIGKVGSERIGNVRFDRRFNDVWEVSINIAPGWRGMGLGAQLIAQSIDLLLAKKPVTRLYAMAKIINGPSIASFKRVGFPVKSPDPGFPGLERFDPGTEVFMEKILQPLD